MSTQRDDIRTFISMPMQGLSRREIKERTRRLFNIFRSTSSDFLVNVADLDISTDNYDDNVYNLSQLIAKVSESSRVILVSGWKYDNACLVVKNVCDLYHIPYIIVSDEMILD